MKKKIFNFISHCSICLVLIICISMIGINEAQGAETITFTRENLQDFVVSTALKYYYKRTYSDYEQYALDKYNKMYQVNVNNTPEEVSVANQYKIDCTGFAMMVYLQSLGYMMTENDLYKAYPYHRIYNDPVQQEGGLYVDYRNNNVAADTELLFEQYNKAWWTDQLLLSAGYAATNNIDYFNKLFVYSTGDYVLLDKDISVSKLNDIPKISSITSIPKYGEENYEEYKSQLIDEIRKNIQPGDILLYATEKTSGSRGAHGMIYVGNVLSGKDEVGFIHSTGYDMKYEKDDTTGEATGKLVENGYGYDENGGIKYSEFYDYLGNLYTEEKTPKYFVIIRPINYYLDTTDESATVTSDVLRTKIQYDDYKNNFNKYLSNTISRDVSRYLDVEHYVTLVGSKQYFPYGTAEKPISKYVSMGKKDQLRYNIKLTNQSYVGFCSKNKYTTQIECETAGYEWNTTESISNIVVKIPLPDNTIFVEDSCGDDDYCSYDSDTNYVTLRADNLINDDGSNKSVTLSFLLNLGDNIDSVDFKNIDISYEFGDEAYREYNIYMPNISVNVEKYDNSSNIISGGNDENDSSYAGVYTKVEDGSCSTITNMIDYIKCVYSDIKEIDLSNLSDIENLENYFTPVTAKINSSDTKSAYIKSSYKENDMLVNGLYGGRELLANFLGDREATYKNWYLEYGDILVTYFDNIPQIYMFTGVNKVSYSATFITIKDGKIYKLGETVESAAGGYTISNSKSDGFYLSRDMFAQDLFAIFRPSKLYNLDTSGDIVNPENPENPENPDLGDNIKLIIAFLVVSIGGIIYSVSRRPKFTIDL